MRGHQLGWGGSSARVSGWVPVQALKSANPVIKVRAFPSQFTDTNAGGDSRPGARLAAAISRDFSDNPLRGGGLFSIIDVFNRKELLSDPSKIRYALLTAIKFRQKVIQASEEQGFVFVKLYIRNKSGIADILGKRLFKRIDIELRVAGIANVRGHSRKITGQSVEVDHRGDVRAPGIARLQASLDIAFYRPV